MRTETAFILLFVVATAVALATRRLRIPYTVALAIAGCGLGALGLFPAIHLSKELLFSLFLPGLIFEAALHIRRRELRADWAILLFLVLPGIFASVAVIALVLVPLVHAVGGDPEFGWRQAAVFGALISATDPIAVVSLFREMGVPRRLTVLLDAESLLNDGTAFIFFILSLSLLSGRPIEALEVTRQFAWITGIGVLAGIACGMGAALIIRRIDDPMIEIAVTTIAAYGSFSAAEAFHASGIISTVVAGLICGNQAVRKGMSEQTIAACASFWAYVAFALNSIVFLLVGLELHLAELAQDGVLIAVAFGVVTAARALIVLSARWAGRWSGAPLPRGWPLLMTWGGLRGALPMVLALSLSADIPSHDLLVTLTFGVAGCSLLIQGLTMGRLVKRVLRAGTA